MASNWLENARRFHGKLLSNEVRGRSGDDTLIDYSKLKRFGSGVEQSIIAPAYDSLQRMKNIAPHLNFQLGPSTFRPLKDEIALCKTKICDGKSKARPGYSIHGWGRAVDFSVIYSACSGKLNTPPKTKKGQDLYEWLKVYGGDYGWVNYTAECWHWEYVGEPLGSLTSNPAIKGNTTNYTPAVSTATRGSSINNMDMIKSDSIKELENKPQNTNNEKDNNETLMKRDEEMPLVNPKKKTAKCRL